MIHIIHTPAAELARQRIRRAWCSLPLVLLPGLGVLLVAAHTMLPLAPPQNDCDFLGVTYLLPEETSSVPPSPPAPRLHPNLPGPDIPSPELLVHHQTEFHLPELQLITTDEKNDITLPLETDATWLNRKAEAPAAAPPPAPAAHHITQKESSLFIPPGYLDCPQPDYPPSLRARRVQGTVGIRIAVSAEGAPTRVEIITSSGNNKLDTHVRRWILQPWRFSPARRDGHPTAAMVDTSIHFVLHA